MKKEMIMLGTLACCAACGAGDNTPSCSVTRVDGATASISCSLALGLLVSDSTTLLLQQDVLERYETRIAAALAIEPAIARAEGVWWRNRYIPGAVQSDDPAIYGVWQSGSAYPTRPEVDAILRQVIAQVRPQSTISKVLTFESQPRYYSPKVLDELLRPYGVMVSMAQPEALDPNFTTTTQWNVASNDGADDATLTVETDVRIGSIYEHNKRKLRIVMSPTDVTVCDAGGDPAPEGGGYPLAATTLPCAPL